MLYLLQRIILLLLKELHDLYNPKSLTNKTNAYEILFELRNRAESGC